MVRKARVVAENSFEMYSGDDVSQCDTLFCCIHSIKQITPQKLIDATKYDVSSHSVSAQTPKHVDFSKNIGSV